VYHISSQIFYSVMSGVCVPSVKPLRVVVYANVWEIPGGPQSRDSTLGHLVCQETFGRRYIPREDSEEGDVFDYCYIPPDFDSDRAFRRYFIYDLNVGALNAQPASDLTNIPSRAFRAKCQNEKLYALLRIHRTLRRKAHEILGHSRP